MSAEQMSFPTATNFTMKTDTSVQSAALLEQALEAAPREGLSCSTIPLSLYQQTCFSRDYIPMVSCYISKLITHLLGGVKKHYLWNLYFLLLKETVESTNSFVLLSSLQHWQGEKAEILPKQPTSLH